MLSDKKTMVWRKDKTHEDPSSVVTEKDEKKQGLTKSVFSRASTGGEDSKSTNAKTTTDKPNSKESKGSHVKKPILGRAKTDSTTQTINSFPLDRKENALSLLADEKKKNTKAVKATGKNKTPTSSPMPGQREKVGSSGHYRIRALGEQLKGMKCLTCNHVKRNCKCQTVYGEDDWKAWAVAAAIADGEGDQDEPQKTIAQQGSDSPEAVAQVEMSHFSPQTHDDVPSLRLSCCGNSKCQGGKKCCDKQLKQSNKRVKSNLARYSLFHKPRKDPLKEHAKQKQQHGSPKSPKRMLRRRSDNGSTSDIGKDLFKTPSSTISTTSLKQHAPDTLEHMVLQLQLGGLDIEDKYLDLHSCKTQSSEWDDTDYYDRPSRLPSVPLCYDDDDGGYGADDIENDEDVRKLE